MTALIGDQLRVFPRANALGMGIVETGRFAQILGRKASKKVPVKRDDLPDFEIPE